MQFEYRYYKLMIKDNDCYIVKALSMIWYLIPLILPIFFSITFPSSYYGISYFIIIYYVSHELTIECSNMKHLQRNIQA